MRIAASLMSPALQLAYSVMYVQKTKRLCRLSEAQNLILKENVLTDLKT